MKIQAIKSYNYTQNRLRNNSGTSTPVSNNENAKSPIYISSLICKHKFSWELDVKIVGRLRLVYTS